MNDPNYTGGGPVGMWQPQDLVGQVLADRYQVRKLLGEGGMGSVFLGEHVTLRKRVAIKVLHQELCRDQTQVDRFLQEARAASMIGHENIVDIVDFGPVPGGSVFFAMEFLEGEDLSDLLKRERRLAWPRARDLMLQIIRALAAAHDKGIIHRDLKPANCFLVRRSDGRDFVKLLDFGIAKVTDPDSGDSGGLTRTGAVFGTAKYMAPEQACGDPADARTDVYAAAICLYEFLTGQVPYDGDNFMRVLSRHLTEPLTLPSTMAPDANISPAVEAVIVKALSKKADDRYQSMREFEAAILAIGLDGNLVGQRYEGPPLAPPPVVGSTMWIPPAASGAPGTASSPSQPPEGRGGTVMLDSRPDVPEHLGTVKLGQHGWGQPEPSGQPMNQPSEAHAPITRSPSGAATGAPLSSRPETRSPGGDYTVFATDEPRSPVKFAVLLGLGGIAAIGGGGLAAWLALRGSFVDDSATKPETAVVAQVDPKEAAPPPDAPEEEPQLVIGEPAEEPAIEAPPAEVEAVEAAPEPVEAEEAPPPAEERVEPKETGRRRSSRSSSRERPRPSKAEPAAALQEALASHDVARGFGRAKAAAAGCKGGLPGMQIKVRATINAEGNVIDAKPLTNSGLPVAQCVADAVKARAKFIKTKKALDSKDWTFKF